MNIYEAKVKFFPPITMLMIFFQNMEIKDDIKMIWFLDNPHQDTVPVPDPTTSRLTPNTTKTQNTNTKCPSALTRS